MLLRYCRKKIISNYFKIALPGKITLLIFLNFLLNKNNYAEYAFFFFLVRGGGGGGGGGEVLWFFRDRNNFFLKVQFLLFFKLHGQKYFK